jgi:nucleotidyltransferase substrate binding protein (TIGR01987 family)
MDTITLRYKKIMQAFATLDIAVHNFKHLDSTPKPAIPAFTDFDEMRRTYRDSMIQRFEYCTELFWKYLKKYLEEYVQAPDINGPAPVIRASYAAGLLDDQEAENALDMVKDRNLTSHIYKEEIAETLAAKIPQHCALMSTIARRLTPNK